MGWWQSLLIAIIPASITGLISFIIAFVQIQNAKKELQDKYEKDKISYISRTQFDTEYNIYKELSEKTVSMVADILNLFPLGLYYTPADEETKKEYYNELYKLSSDSTTDASRSMAKYACFIPEQQFNKFLEIKKLCYLQVRYFFEYINSRLESREISECFKRTQEISDMLDLLTKDLRVYLTRLPNKREENKNAD